MSPLSAGPDLPGSNGDRPGAAAGVSEAGVGSGVADPDPADPGVAEPDAPGPAPRE